MPNQPNSPSSDQTDHPRSDMRAVVQTAYGDADVLTVGSVPIPQPGPKDVLIEVVAAGLDRGTWHLMEGVPYVVRLGFGLKKPKMPIPGLDVSGVVKSVGPEVTRFKAGDLVFGTGKGTFAEFAVAPESKLAHKPKSLSFEQAAVTSISGLTALQALRDIAKVQSGQSVLIIGASGGVGTYAVQIAKSMGANVSAVCSSAKTALVESLGADSVIAYDAQDFTKMGIRYDAVIDIAGNTKLSDLRGVLTERGTLVIVGGEEACPWLGGLDRQIRAAMLSPLVKQRLAFFLSRENSADVQALAELAEQGLLVPAVDNSFALEDAADAMRRLADGEVRGKIAIVVRPDMPPIGD